MNKTHWKKVKDIFETSSGLAGKEREDFLNKECGDNTELRREVDELLASLENSDSFLEDPAVNELASMFEEKKTLALNQTTGEIKDGHFVAGTILDERYRIIGLLGKGGMGEVYLVYDSELHRKVALKILPADFADNDERMKRFIQEARSVSALNHPNILTIYEIGETAGIRFIATEYIEGETLKEYLKSNTLTFKSVLDIAIQITSALAAAHEAGIIHRDIKPDNVMIRKDGIVKVLDFGLAKTTTTNLAADTDEYLAASENILTTPGMIMGTPQYMSPEQARGEKVDSRSDIFSLGVVIYEMITSHLPFVGENSMDVISSILRDEPPPLGRYVENAPDKLDRVIIKTLRKNPKKRYQFIKDFLIDLKELQNDLQFEVKHSLDTDEAIAKTTVRNAANTAKHKRFLPVFAALFLFVVTISLWWFMKDNSKEADTSPQSSFKTVEITNWKTASGEFFTSASFSPNGRLITFDSSKSGTQSIWVKQTNSGEPFQVTKDEFDNKFPVWSPDGEYLAFFSIRGGIAGIWRIPHLGGSSKTVARLEDVGSQLKYWSKSGKIYYQSRRNLYAVDEESGENTQITDFDSKEVPIDILDISPDETRVAYLIHEEDNWNIIIKPLVGETNKKVVSSQDEINGFVWHPDGKSILYSQLKNDIFQIFETDLEGGNPTQLSFAEKDNYVQDITSDGTRILFDSATENSDLWRVNIENGDETVVSSEITSELWADVSPDNETVVFQSIKNLSQGNKIYEGSILMKSLSETDPTTRIAESGLLPMWSPDGETLAFMKLAGQEIEIWKINRTGNDLKRLTTDDIPSIFYTVSPYNRTETNELSWSPKDNVLAYQANRDGRSNLWIVSADGSSDRNLTDNNDENWWLYCPIWNADGTKIAFSSRSMKRNSKGERTYQFWIFDLDTNEKRKIFETKETLRLLGWSQDENELVFALSKKEFSPLPPEVYIYNVSIKTGEGRIINTLEDTYYYNIHLSPDKKTIGFTSRSTKTDEIWIASADGGQPRRLTRNNDPRVYFSSLSWSPDGKFIIFGKQSRFSLLSMIVNLKLTEQKNEKTNN